MQLNIIRKSRLLSFFRRLHISYSTSASRNGHRVNLFHQNKQIVIKDRCIHFLRPSKVFKKIENLRPIIATKSVSDSTTLQDNPKILKNNLIKKNEACVPTLSSIGITDVTNLVGIIIGVSHISWARVSLLPLTLLDWNTKVLPTDFRTSSCEQNTLRLAYNVKHMLPDSDLYVMETFPIIGKNIYEKVNMIQLSSMLTILLNGLNTDPNNMQKVVFQKAFVMNKLHNLTVGSERVSTRLTIEKVLNKQQLPLFQNFSEDEFVDVYKEITISPKHLSNYYNANLEKKDDLSLALLFTLSFLDVNIFKNEISISKIKKRAKMTIIKKIK